MGSKRQIWKFNSWVVFWTWLIILFYNWRFLRKKGFQSNDDVPGKSLQVTKVSIYTYNHFLSKVSVEWSWARRGIIMFTLRNILILLLQLLSSSDVNVLRFPNDLSSALRTKMIFSGEIIMIFRKFFKVTLWQVAEIPYIILVNILQAVIWLRTQWNSRFLAKTYASVAVQLAI